MVDAADTTAWSRGKAAGKASVGEGRGPTEQPQDLEQRLRRFWSSDFVASGAATSSLLEQRLRRF